MFIVSVCVPENLCSANFMVSKFYYKHLSAFAVCEKVSSWHIQGDGGLPVKYQLVLNKTDEGYSIHCPGLPGCGSQGQSEEEALENIAEAISDDLTAVQVM